MKITLEIQDEMENECELVIEPEENANFVTLYGWGDNKALTVRVDALYAAIRSLKEKRDNDLEHERLLAAAGR